MRKACVVSSDPFYENNRLFDLSDPIANRDNCLYAFALLKKNLADKNIDLATSDINSIEASDIVFYNEMPKKLPDRNSINKSFLLLFETHLIRPDNWNIRKHNYFHKVFTWHDNYANQGIYKKINFSHIFPKEIPKDISLKEGFCTLIASNKKVKNSLELYSKREEAIRWFEKFHIENFDLYGRGWDRYVFKGGMLSKVLNKSIFITKLFLREYPSYKGVIDNKFDTLKKYRYAICYENAKDIPGYITEKIFDCFFSGCIPIYWGANNISSYIPDGCYIDKRKFKTYEDLYSYLQSISDEEYIERLNIIENAINSKELEIFSAEYFVNKVIQETTKN